jgi:ferric-dicitrate binding protein FerR (iron transport regulator)
MIPPIRRLYKVAPAFVCAAAVLVAALPSVSGAAGSKQLRHVRGTVGYQLAAAAALTPVFGKIDLPDEALAVTQASSVAELALPDSSVVTLGADTRVQVGAFNTTADGPGSRIVVNNGTLRFDIKRPVGGHANCVFQTATSQIAVRGTIGLLSVINGVTKVACVQCAADSVTVTAGGQTFTLATGQTLTVTTAGVAPGTLGPDGLTQFGDAGVPTSAGGGAGSRHPTRTWCRSRGWRRNRAERFCADELAADPGCPE